MQLKSCACIDTTLEISLLLQMKVPKLAITMHFLGSNATEMHWRSGLCPRPRWGSLQRLPIVAIDAAVVELPASGDIVGVGWL